ncbi:hypothetical protein A7978_04580 (plasmid) [Borrelia turicatae]|uniref:Uncharacterized protein n=2 Tax=Borrelia turicatae TaxID=142 RepID=T1ECK9_BORT9|nr:hypothetical protein [Borrelia turicatae]ADN26473.1 hypothetical protein BTA044 [Borrelia turicatae 91E135]ANF34390.1 hypothetical protein A7978_04580 [Borrelia turicatae]UPA13974.1 hypothetical protein bt91E135_001136 [Borrelia turicatae 91E135]UPA15467.1 hypothetical protein btBTE5EL_001147 [Borrelia turicatae]
MKKFYAVLFMFNVLLSLLIITCNKSAESPQQTGQGLVSGNEQMVDRAGLTSKLAKTDVSLCAEDAFEKFPRELLEDEKIERDKAYAQIESVVKKYKTQLFDEEQSFQVYVEKVSKQSKTNGSQETDSTGDNLETLSQTHFYEVSDKFSHMDIVYKIYASLGYDVKVINKLEAIIVSLNLDITAPIGDSLAANFHKKLLDLSYGMLFSLYEITIPAWQITNEYLYGTRLSSLANSKFAQKLIELSNHLDEFIQTRARFIDNIKNVILNVKIGNRQSMLVVLQEIMNDKGDIISAFNFAQRKAAVIQCAVNNLLRAL